MFFNNYTIDGAEYDLVYLVELSTPLETVWKTLVF